MVTAFLFSFIVWRTLHCKWILYQLSYPPQHLLLNVYLREEIDVSAANNLFLKKERNCCLLLFPLVFRSQPRVTR